MISKEEREAIEERLGQRWLYSGGHAQPESRRIDEAQIDVHVLLAALDTADSEKAELQAENERLRTGLQGLREALAEHFTNSRIQQEPLPAGHAYLNRIDVLLEGDAWDWRRS